MAKHPLQSLQWAEFREKTGIKVIKLKNCQVFFHPLPKLPYTVGYLPKGPLPTEEEIVKLKKIGRKQKAIFIKIEPNLNFPPGQVDQQAKEFLLKYCRQGKDHFYRYTFQLDLTKSEAELLAGMKAKTRYNIRLAQRHGVKVVQDKSAKALAVYLQLMWETTQRQGFLAHTKQYHRLLWETFKDTDIYHLFLAKYQDKILAAAVFFVYDRVLYYPYGASSNEYRQVMAPYAIFWEAIKFGKQRGCKIFDMWGCLGPNANPTNPWFGFHRFKAGFGGQLVESIGAYDLVIRPNLYCAYLVADQLRSWWLKSKRFLRRWQREAK